MSYRCGVRTKIYLSVGILARNEEKTIGAALASLFKQSLFPRLAERGLFCEVLCVANGCTDGTEQVAARAIGVRVEGALDEPVGKVVSLAERGRNNAWNQFVHRLSAREAEYLVFMDADIVLRGVDTLWKMLAALEQEPSAHAAVDVPRKDLLFKQRKSLRERLSLAVSQLTRHAPAQLCGQLYCIRAEVARKVYLPRDLAACEDGFIKSLLCTDFLACALTPERIRLADGAEHIFAAYTSAADVFRNQKRQVMGQTIVHILIDNHLKELPETQRACLAETLRHRDEADPAWLKRLIADHLKERRFFWRLYPGFIRYPFRRWLALPVAKRLVCFPAAVARLGFSLVAGFAAWQMLKRGCTDYWPQPERQALTSAEVV